MLTRVILAAKPTVRGLATSAADAVKFDFKGCVAIVTGGCSGIGEAVAKGFARNGASVVIGDFNPAAQKTVDAIKAAGGKALFVRTDVSKWQDCEKLVADTVKEYGRLDFAFNNAGIGPNPMVPIADTTVEEYHRVIGVNQHGVFYCMKFQVPAMAKSGGGSIINTASIAGSFGMIGVSPYTASKHAVIGLTRNAAIDSAAVGVRVNAIAPGFIATPILSGLEAVPGAMDALAAKTLRKRIGEPEEMVNAVMLLASPTSSYTTGSVVTMDGGHTISF